jgi:hypothetical protein
MGQAAVRKSNCANTRQTKSGRSKNKKGRQLKAASFAVLCGVKRYFSCVEMLPKLVFSLVPMPFTAAIIATEMPAAIRPYSMAVAPD